MGEISLACPEHKGAVLVWSELLVDDFEKMETHFANARFRVNILGKQKPPEHPDQLMTRFEFEF